MHEAPLDDNYYPSTRQKEAMVEQISELEHLISVAQGEIDYFEQEIMAIDDNIEKIKSACDRWDMNEELDELILKTKQLTDTLKSLILKIPMRLILKVIL